MIPYGKQDITQADIDAVVAVLKSDCLTQGPVMTRFEQAVAARTGADYGVAANSATSALHLACRALGVGNGSRVWTSAITFVASANCARYCGADVDFVDIDPNTYNMSPGALEIKLAEAESTGKLPHVLIPVHMCGQSCDMAAIHALSRKYGFSIIEDASHAIGGAYQGRPVGSCFYSDITVFSFHPVKIITTGEGGMAMTNDPALARKMELLRSHGITRDPAEMTHDPDGPWYYQQIDLGYNYRMTDIQAALGISQLERLDAFVSKRRDLARRYDQLLDDLAVITPKVIQDASSSWHLYIIRFQLEAIDRSRKEIFDFLRQKAIGVNVHYIPVPAQPYYNSMGFGIDRYPESEKYYQEAVSLPLFPAMRNADQDKVICSIKEAICQ